MERLRQRKFALDGIDPKSMSGLEIGPLHRPLVDKRDGYRVKYVDHDSTPALRARFAGDPSVRAEDIAEVDYVIGEGADLLDLVGNERFDYIVASHVFEHVPNPVGWLDETYSPLSPGGRLSLIVPDRRYTFDIIRPPTSLGEWLEAYYTARKTPGFSNVFDQHYYWRVVDVPAIWRSKFNPWALSRPGAKPEILETARATLGTNVYVDVHCNVMTDHEFSLLFSGLREFELTRFQILSLRPCERNDNEFFVQLVATSQ